MAHPALAPSASREYDKLVRVALRQQLGVDEEELERVRAKKAAERGRFEDGVVLERLED